jgi:hypothetical protein
MEASWPPATTRSVPRYGELFDHSADLREEIGNRIEIGDIVIDDEHATGFNLRDMPAEIHAVVVYRVADDLIQRAELLG